MGRPGSCRQELATRIERRVGAVGEDPERINRIVQSAAERHPRRTIPFGDVAGWSTARHFEQQVAVKLLRHGLTGVEGRLRFLAERQLLAELKHPAIARLLAGGVSGDGMPYFVMECVEGQPITTHCRLHALDLDRRLQIFLDVCEAVQYAHL